MIEALAVNAQRFRAIGDPTRLKILELLTNGPRCVCEVQPELGIAANLLSHHLKILREADLITSVKIGRRIEYRLDPNTLLQLHAAIPTPRPIPTPRLGLTTIQLTLNKPLPAFQPGVRT
jgi:ArsR family transcriptional regulator